MKVIGPATQLRFVNADLIAVQLSPDDAQRIRRSVSPGVDTSEQVEQAGSLPGAVSGGF